MVRPFKLCDQIGCIIVTTSIMFKDPPRKYERLSKTVERVRKTSAILVSAEQRKRSRWENRKHAENSIAFFRLDFRWSFNAK